MNEDGTVTILTNLEEGEYVLKYENEDGTLTEIGLITIGAETITIPITWNEGKSCSYTIGQSYDLTDNASYCTSDVIEVESGVEYTLTVNSTVTTTFRIVGANNSGVVTELIKDTTNIAIGNNTFTFTPSNGTTQIRVRSYEGVSTKATWTLTREG